MFITLSNRTAGSATCESECPQPLGIKRVVTSGRSHPTPQAPAATRERRTLCKCSEHCWLEQSRACPVPFPASPQHGKRCTAQQRALRGNKAAQDGQCPGWPWPQPLAGHGRLRASLGDGLGGGQVGPLQSHSSGHISAGTLFQGRRGKTEGPVLLVTGHEATGDRGHREVLMQGWSLLWWPLKF